MITTNSRAKVHTCDARVGRSAESFGTSRKPMIQAPKRKEQRGSATTAKNVMKDGISWKTYLVVAKA